MPKSALPDHLKDKLHNDWIWPFSYIPRSWTAYKLFPPITILKYNCTETYEWNGKTCLHPIQRKLNGKLFSFHINIPLFISISFRWGSRGAYFICGFRDDAVDKYFNFPTLDISYIGNGIGSCARVLNTADVVHPKSTLNIIVDVFVSYPDLDHPDGLQKTYHRRSLQKI